MEYETNMFLLKSLEAVVLSIGDYVLLVARALKILFSKPPRWGLFSEQLYNIGVLSLPVVAITGFSTGLVLAAQSFFQLSDKGLSGATGLMVAKAMITELGPILTSFMVTGRVGSAMCAEIGSMRVTEQIAAMQSMAVNPIGYLVVPRLIGGTVMMPFLTIFSVLMGIFGGYLLSVFFFHMSPSSYFDPMPVHINFFDCYTGLIKSVAFGFLISTICCHKGFTAEGGAAGVGNATTHSVVICYSCILVLNFMLTLGLNVFHVLFEQGGAE